MRSWMRSRMVASPWHMTTQVIGCAERRDVSRMFLPFLFLVLPWRLSSSETYFYVAACRKSLYENTMKNSCLSFIYRKIRGVEQMGDSREVMCGISLKTVAIGITQLDYLEVGSS